jgi:hypothetical protein
MVWGKLRLRRAETTRAIRADDQFAYGLLSAQLPPFLHLLTSCSNATELDWKRSSDLSQHPLGTLSAGGVKAGSSATQDCLQYRFVRASRSSVKAHSSRGGSLRALLTSLV